MTDSSRDRLGALAWLGFALYVTFAALRLGLGRPSEPGPGLIFFWSGVALAALAVPLVIRGRHVDPRREQDVRPGNGVSMGLGVGLLLLYVLLFERLGFLATTLGLTAAVVRLGGERRWTRVGAFAVAASAGAYVILHTWLGLRLPAGFVY
jgi:hypothetical protein